MSYDKIEELAVAKGTDEVVEIDKFNPFHDAAGKFSSSNGFKTYSANPNTRAGAMAIARSAAAGHMNTVNVHRDAQSTGTTIRQNANWLGQGHQQTRSQTGSATLNRRVEPGFGLPGASAVGAQWQSQNQQQGRTTTPGKKPAAPQKPAQAAQKPAAQPKQQPQKQPQQQQQTQQKPASDRQPVSGKDISKTFKYDPRAQGDAMDQVTEQQGFKGKPTLMSDKTQFSAAVKASGTIGYRTINDGTDVVTGKRKSAAQFADDLKNSDTMSHNGTGGKVYGSGIYVVVNPSPTPGRGPSRTATDSAKNESKCYGNHTSKTLAMTLDPSAKVGDFNTVSNAYSRLSASEKRRFGNNMAAYAASQGYDALRAKGAGWNSDYMTVYNRTKLIIFDS